MAACCVPARGHEAWIILPAAGSSDAGEEFGAALLGLAGEFGERGLGVGMVEPGDEVGDGEAAGRGDLGDGEGGVAVGRDEAAGEEFVAEHWLGRAGRERGELGGVGVLGRERDACDRLGWSHGCMGALCRAQGVCLAGGEVSAEVVRGAGELEGWALAR